MRLKTAILIVLFLLLFSSTEIFAKPRFSYENLNIDFGDVVQGEKLEYIFYFKNSGTSELVLSKITTNCGCTVAWLSSDRIAPSVLGQIVIEVDTKHRKGAFERKVFITTNDPQNSQVILLLKANVVDIYHNEESRRDDIFYDPCARCHIYKGFGQQGKKLFFSVCALCHRKSSIAPSLSDLEKVPRERLKNAIEMGVNSKKMPPFLNGLGGPLNKTDIKSLIDYIKNSKGPG